MSHRTRILKVLADLPQPVQRGQPWGLARSVLEGLARTKNEKARARDLIPLMVAAGQLVMRGDKKGAVYGLPKVPRG